MYIKGGKSELCHLSITLSNSHTALFFHLFFPRYSNLFGLKIHVFLNALCPSIFSIVYFTNGFVP